MLPLLRLAGLGRRRRVRRIGGKRRVGGRKMLMIQGSGRRRMRGRGIFDTIKNIGKKAFSLARSVPIVSTGLKLAGQDKYADTARALGFGRRRRVGSRLRKRRTRRYGGRMSVYGGRRKRPVKRRFSVYGGRKRRTRKRRMRGGLLGSVLRGLLGGRRRRRTYPMGLFTRRR